MQTIPAKSLLSAYREPGWFASNYTVNIYRGCPHACIYCDSRSECYGIDDFSVVRAKENALAILERELSTKKRKGTILTGAMSDPYNPCEREQELTRGFLKLADRYRFGVVAITKSDLVCRDADLFAAIGSHSPAAVNITITAADDSVAKRIEPHAASSSDRFSAIEKLSAKDILCGVILLPVLPFITDTKENISAIVSRAAESGATFVYAEKYFAVSLRDRQREYFYDRLDEQFPGLRERYERMFGDQYWCGSPDAELWDTFVRECNAAGLLWRHEEIDSLLRRRGAADVQSRLW
ncbi:MAG: radical SAM protein [Methanocorpusculum sp.]|uniref:Radical SAM protein n=1 Tax=Methanocorpusculum petauri TaxID=3002863 RepID=A0ABT4IGB1_9EURY|nr:radical SAM protein [Methanocorpusculum petauri]MCZ0860292.1 radical SAM protein [Methanocorpusculum petauri]MDE2443192.1 radical SAM protein [Methanocorpusculum sp.]MDE2522298.1 radical SAM protein [Methanocorpusculum sp.]MDE2525107.1 radical SAM protein [Methanocorpusculum sp.]